MTDEVSKRLTAIEARLRIIEEQAGINVKPRDPTWTPVDWTAGMSMSGSVAKGMAKATAGVDGEVVADGRKHNPSRGA